MFFPLLSDDAPLEPPISPQLRAHLEHAGLSDAGWMLGAQLGIRTWRSLLQLTTVEVDLCCERLASAGFAPGHAAALRGLCNVGNGVYLQPCAQHGIWMADSGASGAHTTTETLLAKVTDTRSLLQALQLSVASELLGPGNFPGSSVVVQECLHMLTALDALRFQALSDEALGVRPAQECGLVEKLAALALRSCEDAHVALATRPQGSADAQQQTGQMLALRAVAHELLVVCCARALPIETLRTRFVPDRLRERLDEACGFNLSLEQHSHLKSRLGKAKYHVFTPEKQWGGKKRGTASRAAAGNGEVASGADLAIPAGTASREAAGSGEVASGEGAMEAEAVEMASGEGAAVRALSLASLLPGDVFCMGHRLRGPLACN